HDAGLGEQTGHLPRPTNVLVSVGLREAQIRAQAVTQVVAVEAVGGDPLGHEESLQSDGHRRLARTRETGEPDGGPQRRTFARLDVTVVPGDVGAHEAGPRSIPAPTVVLVTSSMRMKDPVVRLRRYSS